MKRVKYHYNPNTCQYEPVKPSALGLTWGALRFFFSALVAAFGIYTFHIHYFDSPKERYLKKENITLKEQYTQLRKTMDKVEQELAHLQERDDHLYRAIFQADPVPSSVRQAGVGGVDRYQQLSSKGSLIVETFKRVDQLKKKMLVQNKSYEELMDTAKRHARQMACTPMIPPVGNQQLRYLSSGFGRRKHPVTKCYKMHAGIDLAVRQGTPVYATADGIVRRAERGYNGGLGNVIEINHGNGYVTRYAHLQKFSVKLRQSVKRGQIIAWSGITGLVAGAHLHYEVIKNGKNVDPIDYCFQGLTPKEYEEIVRLAAAPNQSLD